MGYDLLPKHSENVKSGWNKIANLDQEVLKNIDLSTIALLQSKEQQEDSKLPDKFFANYGIASQWSAAYLFHSALRENIHPLHDQVMTLLLNLLHDYYSKGLELISLSLTSNTTFSVFLEEVPEFLIFDDPVEKRKKMYFFVSKTTGEVVGGLSRSTLAWVSHNYSPASTMQQLLQNDVLALCLAKIKKCGDPKSDNTDHFDIFWANPELERLIECAGNRELSYKDIDGMPVKWLVDVEVVDPKILNNMWYYSFAEKGVFLFDDKALSDAEVMGIGTPPNFASLLKNQRERTYLPAGRGHYPWLLFEELLENNWVQMIRLDSKNQFVKGYQTTLKNGDAGMEACLLWPVKPEFLKYGFDLNLVRPKPLNLSADRTIAGGTFLLGTRVNGQLFQHSFHGKMSAETRSIAIYPPFASKVTPNYVIEVDNLNGLDGKPPLEFYDCEGKRLEADNSYLPKTESQGNSTRTVSRVYKLKHSGQFPSFIRIGPDEANLGLLQITEKKKEPGNRAMIVGIDFGSSHTIVACRCTDEKEVEYMTFDNSSPLTICDNDTVAPLLYDFIPDGLRVDPPESKTEYDSNLKCWLPFRTLWSHFAEEGDFLQKGIIPLSYTPEQTGLGLGIGIKNRKIIADLKWTTRTVYRNGFLDHLIMMILIEAEAKGARSVEIRWSYPNAFSDNESKLMRNFYNDLMRNKYGSTREEWSVSFPDTACSEAYNSLEYFIQCSQLTLAKLAVTVDIGGRTSDIAFVEDKRIKWEDSVEFGGGVLAENSQVVAEYVHKRKAESGDFSTRDYDEVLRTWPLVHPSWGGKIDDFTNWETNPGIIKYYEKIGLFYGGLFYYLGLHLRRFKNSENGPLPPLKHVALGGNGILFLRYITGGSEINERSLGRGWAKLLKKMLAAGHGIPYSNYENTDLLLAPHPKREVASGMVMLQEPRPQDTNVTRLFGLPVKGKPVKGKEVFIDWDGWDKRSCEEISFMTVDYKIFQNFLTDFYNSYEELVGKDKFDKTSREVGSKKAKNDIDKDVKSQLLKRGKETLSNPVFLIALKSWIKHLD